MVATMDLRQLAALVAVDDHGSFSAAARALYTVQSNVSAHIANLERELGVTSSTGRRAASRRRVGRGGGPGGSSASWTPGPRCGLDGPGGGRRGAPRCDRHDGPLARPPAPAPCTPRTRCSRHPRSQHHVADPLVVAGGLDLAVVNLPVEDPEIDTSVLFTEELVLLATASSPLYGRTEVSFSELSAIRSCCLLPGRRCGASLTPRPGGPG